MKIGKPLRMDSGSRIAVFTYPLGKAPLHGGPVHRLKDYRQELEGVLQLFQDDPDFGEVDLLALLDGQGA